jgi:hypothetical protein
MERLLFKPVHSSSLAAYRILFGILNAAGLIRFWHLGWIERSFTNPQFLFKYLGFEWVKLWPGDGIYIHYAVLIGVCACFSLGLFTRVMSVLFFLGFTYIELLDLSNYLNHYYLISLLAFINIFLPLNARWSLDNVLGLSQKREFVPAWTLNWLRGQVGTVYFFAGLAKLQSDWLLRAQPLNLWLTSNTDLPVIGPWLSQLWVQYAFSWAGFLFDTTIAFWMLNRKARPYAYAAIVVFHAMTYALFPIGMFPFIMVFSALVFFDSNWPEQLWAYFKKSSVKEECNISVFSSNRLVPAALVLFFAIQWLMPLRHFLYPGNVLWSEEGMRFSWKVMVREKNTSTVFKVVEKKSGRYWFVSPSEYLLRHQEAEMSGTPDMLVQFAHFLKGKFAKQNLDVSVYAIARTAFNGRPSAPFVDPNVDLASVEDSLWPKKWIRPAPETPPETLWVNRQ